MCRFFHATSLQILYNSFSVAQWNGRQRVSYIGSWMCYKSQIDLGFFPYFQTSLSRSKTKTRKPSTHSVQQAFHEQFCYPANKMSSRHRYSQHNPPDSPRDAHSPGYWPPSPSGYRSPSGASGRSSLAYGYGTRETTVWTIPRDKPVEYVFSSTTSKRRNWSACSNWSSTEPELEHRGSLRMKEPRAPSYHNHRHIGDDPYHTDRGPSYRDFWSPEYSRPRSSDRTYWQGGYNSKPSRSQGHRSHSYSSGEEWDHKSSKHRRDKDSSQTKFETGHRSSRNRYSDDRGRRNEHEPDPKISSRRGDEDYYRSNKYKSGPTSNQKHYNNDSGRSRKYEPDYKTGSRHQDEDNSRRNKYKPEPRYEKAHPKIASAIEREKEELVNYYATLGISSLASSHEIKKAARSKRVEVHPDKCIKPDMSKSEKAKVYEIAAAVGQAADVLTDGELKSKYDKKLARQWAYELDL